MIENAKKIIHTIEPGLFKYKAIMDSFNDVDVSQDIEFKRRFNGFYRVRQRTESFYNIYYSLMENSKHTSVEFKDILEHIYQELGRIEPSFSSKLLATINPQMPIWDTFVLDNLKLKKPAQNSKTRLEDTIELYNKIVEWYQNMTNSSEGKELISIFDNAYPNSNISDVKKIDFILWQIRE